MNHVDRYTKLVKIPNRLRTQEQREEIEQLEKRIWDEYTDPKLGEAHDQVPSVDK